MKIPEMIAVLEAAERGEQIEYEVKPDLWMTTVPEWDFSAFNYRIAPKKQELSLVEELRTLNPQFYSEWKDLAARAAKRIHALEEMMEHPVESVSTEELMDELKRRIG
jgi:hypothetical protein